MYFSYTVKEAAKALAAFGALHSQLGGGICSHRCCDKSPPTLWLEATPFVTSSSPEQRSGMVWLSRGSHKAKVKVSIGLGSYLDALGEVVGRIQFLVGCQMGASLSFLKPPHSPSSCSLHLQVAKVSQVLLTLRIPAQRNSSAFEDSCLE